MSVFIKKKKKNAYKGQVLLHQNNSSTFTKIKMLFLRRLQLTLSNGVLLDNHYFLHNCCFCGIS